MKQSKKGHEKLRYLRNFKSEVTSKLWHVARTTHLSILYTHLSPSGLHTFTPLGNSPVHLSCTESIEHPEKTLADTRRTRKLHSFGCKPRCGVQTLNLHDKTTESPCSRAPSTFLMLLNIEKKYIFHYLTPHHLGWRKTRVCNQTTALPQQMIAIKQSMAST